MEDFYFDQISPNTSPLCVFCLSPFTIRAFTRPPEKSASRRLSVRGWRRGGSSQSSIRPRFKPLKCRSSDFLRQHIKGTFRANVETVSLEKILAEIQKAWRPFDQTLKSFTPNEMDDKNGKLSEIVSPILLRRRLSAPETVMRKHALAQQRSDSQDSSLSCSSDSKAASRLSATGSDTNLSRRRDADSMRRATLLRRFLTKPPRGSGSFHEWQRSYSRLSVNSSPEHLIRSQSRRSLNDDFKFSPSHKILTNKNSPKHHLDHSAKYSRYSNGNFENYSSSFSDNVSTSGTITTNQEAYTTFSHNSDSAYTNSRSNFSAFSNNNSTSEFHKEIAEETDASNQEPNKSVSVLSSFSKAVSNELGKTNVNVISNVKLSQSTIDLIFKQVLQDVKNKNSEYQSKARESPLISKVGIGDLYGSEGQLAVPRFSALPTTSSMEVNISSGDSDKESDTVSLVDSLEDQSRKVLKSDNSIELPDNSQKLAKPTSFYIPISLDQNCEVKSVSELMPDSVRDKLQKRQQKREERQSKTRQSSFYSEGFFDSRINTANSRKIKSNKFHLPSIEKLRLDAKPKEQKNNRSVKKKSVGKIDSPEASRSRGNWTVKSKRLSPLQATKKFHLTSANKQTENFEIVECLDASPKQVQKKSKIPVLVNQKPSKLDTNCEQPTYLDFDNPIDGKFDQLIANILIETLNIPEVQNAINQNEPVERSGQDGEGKAKRQFEAIPEEISLQSTSFDDASNNNPTSCDVRENTTDNSCSKNPYQGKAAVACIKDENFSSIPKGWITFYMLHKNRGSPNSTSDEGKLPEIAKTSETKHKPHLIRKPEHKTHFDVVTRQNVKSSPPSENYSSSSDNPQLNTYFPSTNRLFRKPSRRKPAQQDLKQPEEWSVTVCGTTSYGQAAPEVQMCLKFPDKKNCNCPSQSDSGVGEDNDRMTAFPQINQSSGPVYKTKQEKTDSFFTHPRLPEIDPQRLTSRKQRRSESSVPSLSNLSSRIEPRQTRTSTKRYNLTRPKVDYSLNNLESNNNSSIALLNERQFAEIMRRFPELLSITGNAINHDNN